MKTKSLTFDSVDAISVGGSYVVAPDGKATRDDAASTTLDSIAKGAPGTAAEAAEGASPAHSAAPAADSKAAKGAA